MINPKKKKGINVVFEEKSNPAGPEIFTNCEIGLIWILNWTFGTRL